MQITMPPRLSVSMPFPRRSSSQELGNLYRAHFTPGQMMLFKNSSLPNGRCCLYSCSSVFAEILPTPIPFNIRGVMITYCTCGLGVILVRVVLRRYRKLAPSLIFRRRSFPYNFPFSPLKSGAIWILLQRAPHWIGTELGRVLL